MNEAYRHLKDWLNGKRDYNEGMALLLSYGNKPALHLQLCQYKNRSTLAQELKSIFKEVKKKLPSAPVAQRVTHQAPAEVIVARPGKIDKTKSAIYEEYVVNLKEIESLRNNLYYIGRDPVTNTTRPMSEDEIAQSYKLCEMIVQLDDKSRELVADMQYYDSTGKLPVKEVAVSVAAVAPSSIDYREKENCRKAISKHKQKIKQGEIAIVGMSGKDLVKLANKINAWRTKLAQLTDKMKTYGE